MREIENGINDMLSGMEVIAREGAYRERQELLQVLNECTWFDNFGESYYRHRLEIAQIAIDRGMKDEHIPEFLKEELEY